MSDTDAVKTLKGLKKKYEVELEEILQADIYDEEKQHLTEVFGAQVEAISEALDLLEKSEKLADLESSTSSAVKQKYSSQLEEFYKASDGTYSPTYQLHLVDHSLKIMTEDFGFDVQQAELSISTLCLDDQLHGSRQRYLIVQAHNKEQEDDLHLGTITLHEKDARKLKEILGLLF